MHLNETDDNTRLTQIATFSSRRLGSQGSPTIPLSMTRAVNSQLPFSVRKDFALSVRMEEITTHLTKISDRNG